MSSTMPEKASRGFQGPVVLVLGPARWAVSGVATHVGLLLASSLRQSYTLLHFEVGSEGRHETSVQRLRRLALGPFRLAGAVLRHRACIVHINWSVNARAYWRDLAHLVVAKACGARVVFQKHGGELARFTRNPLFARFVRATLRWPDIVVVLSQAELREYRAFVPGQAIAAVPNGVDTAPDPAEPREEEAAAPLHLLYVGRLAGHKGIAETLEALAIARGRGTRPVLTIAGTGPCEGSLRARARSLDLDGQVTFVGAVWGRRKQALMRGADVLVLASHTEGLPYALLEGMAAGLVPIVTPVGAIPEVVRHRHHGLVVPPGSPVAIAAAMEALDQDRAALARMGEACRQQVAADYTKEKLAARFAALYLRLAPPVRPGSAAGLRGPRWS